MYKRKREGGLARSNVTTPRFFSLPVNSRSAMIFICLLLALLEVCDFCMLDFILSLPWWIFSIIIMKNDNDNTVRKKETLERNYLFSVIFWLNTNLASKLFHYLIIYIEKFTFKVAKRTIFIFCHIITLSYCVLEKFYCNQNEACC